MADEEKGEKLYAGKFPTVEALEEGYKNSAKVYQENEALKKQLDDYKAPNEYLKPSNVAIDDKEFEDIRVLAKNSHLTQVQFERLAMETHARNQRRIQDIDAKTKAIGEENLNVLKDYVGKNFPGEMAETVLNKLIMDDNARAAALSHREKILANLAPGIGSSPPIGYHAVTHEDVVKARDAANKMQGNAKLRDTYLRLLKIYNSQK